MEKLTDDIIQYVNARKMEYEKRYHIQILMWSIRKSISRGLDRRTSDLDLVFIFQSLDHQKKHIIFERADRRIEIQCWDIQDILEVIVENKRLAMAEKDFSPYYKSNDLRHYILDYYNGFYVGWGAALSQCFYGFEDICGKQLWNLLEPYVIVRMFFLDLSRQAERIRTGYYLSLNEYLNALWMGMAGIHLLEKKTFSNMQIEMLVQKYLPKEKQEFVFGLTRHFKQTIQKQSNYCNEEEINCIIQNLLLHLANSMEAYQIQALDIEKEVLELQQNLKEIKRTYENAGC